MSVAQRFHKYCNANAITTTSRMPYGSMKTFIKDNVAWTTKQNIASARTIRNWDVAWNSSPSNVLVAAVAGEDTPVNTPSQPSLLRSRAPSPQHRRRRAVGGGRPPKAHLIRVTLYEWFSSIRYAIGWKQLLQRTAVAVQNIWPDFLGQSSSSRHSNASKIMPTLA